MTGLHQFWDHVWPVLVSMSGVVLPAFAWQHRRISIKLDRHQIQVTAMLDTKLRAGAEAGPQASVTIPPVPPGSAESSDA